MFDTTTPPASSRGFDAIEERLVKGSLADLPAFMAEPQRNAETVRPPRTEVSQ